MVPKSSARTASILPTYGFQICIAVLFLAELIYLSVTFDTQVLDTVDSGWARFLGWSPQYLRLATTIAIVVLLFTGKALLRGLGRLASDQARAPQRWAYLIVHGVALLAFIRVTSAVLSGSFASFVHPGLWTLGWVLSGSATLVAWGLALFPARTWRLALAHGQPGIVSGMAVGTVVWAVGFLSEQLWASLARYTFAVVQWLLGFLYTATVSDPAKLVVGTPTFKVFISPQCSGYEGIGLILAFLSVYLWLYRNDLRFPGALRAVAAGRRNHLARERPSDCCLDCHRHVRLDCCRARRLPLPGRLARL